MPPIISFVGWHNSGKTTLCRQVGLHLKEKGYLVAVIKSTKETGIVIDQPGTDTALYKQSGVDAIALMAPDQLIIQRKPVQAELNDIAQTLFPDVDIIVAEGFKGAKNVCKIEVRRDPHAPWIHQQVSGVVALASDHPHGDLRHFTLDQGQKIADYIESDFLLPAMEKR